jgi:septal ring factor EnvC (AmiA/AmiB activator)
MDSMNPIDIGTLLALAAFWFSTTKDKAQKSEELGRMKQQIATLETKSVQVDSQLNDINTKLNQLMESNARLEAQMRLLLGKKNLKFVDTPMSFASGVYEG